jgi:CRISPR-associated protein Csb1
LRRYEMQEQMTLERLRQAVTEGAALRCRRRLQPAGGAGDKVFPPTYEGGKYATEERVINGERLPCVLLDSVQSQANRIELALLEATRAGRINVPLIEVDFAAAGLPEIGLITSLDAPHRIADAILRDSHLDDIPFRETEQGAVLNGASNSNATGLFGVCPTALVFGVWDSTGPLGGQGTKFQRMLVSSFTGINVTEGVRPSSRIDPLQIQRNAGPLYATDNGGWTLDETAAKTSKNKPVKLGDGRPSEANHGNILPSTKGNHGGITMDYALQTVVISLPAVRRLRFPLPDKPADIEAHTALAALALCGAILSIDLGCDLRSRCLLLPEPNQSGWELVHGDGTITAFELNGDVACTLLNDAVAEAIAANLPWMAEPLRLSPQDKLVELVRRSRELAQASGGGD